MGKLIWIILLGSGLSGLVVFLPLAIGGFEALINFSVAKELRITEGNVLWDKWKKAPIPVYFKARIFNLTNPEEIQRGSKPILNELGPYVYLETLEKFDITPDDETDTIRYRIVHTYHFRPELSNGSVDDMITFINIPLVGMAKAAHDFTDDGFMLSTMDNMISERGEKLTKTHTVKEFLFDGFSVQAFLDFLNDPIVQASGEAEIPEEFKDGKMSLLEGKNGTSDGWYRVGTGKQVSSDFARIYTWNDNSSVRVWKDNSCNAINGTDGMFYSPFITEDKELEFFASQLCRSLKFVHTETIDKDGVLCYHYEMDETIYQNVEKNPANWCFCPEKDVSKCNINGLIHLSPCAHGAPLFVSHPHFFGGDEFLRDSVVGLNPNREKHVGYFDIHPKTAMTLEVRHRFQFNMMVQQWPSMQTFAKVQSTMLPIFWIEESADIDEESKGMARLLDRILSTWSFIKWILLLMFTTLTGAGVFLMQQYNKANKTQLLNKKLNPENFIKQ